MTSDGHGTGSLKEQLRAARDEAMSMRGEAVGLIAEIQRLFLMEKDLAQAEMQQARSRAVQGAIMGGMAALFGLLTVIFLFLSIMFALETALPFWAAALVTTGIAALLALFTGVLAMQRIKKVSPMPRRAMQSIQEDISWARSQMRSRTT